MKETKEKTNQVLVQLRANKYILDGKFKVNKGNSSELFFSKEELVFDINSILKLQDSENEDDRKKAFYLINLMKGNFSIIEATINK